MKKWRQMCHVKLDEERFSLSFFLIKRFCFYPKKKKKSEMFLVDRNLKGSIGRTH